MPSMGATLGTGPSRVAIECIEWPPSSTELHRVAAERSRPGPCRESSSDLTARIRGATAIFTVCCTILRHFHGARAAGVAAARLRAGEVPQQRQRHRCCSDPAAPDPPSGRTTAAGVLRPLARDMLPWRHGVTRIRPRPGCRPTCASECHW
ncbi:MAG: hypothetical protein J3K34DRAFT_408940 [Monoraphidium minutum]|nr:MAG: hypothetical protein J3K34DRAFT_408940 [Monoraphidium minutum]